jgi:hypothetical protein
MKNNFFRITTLAVLLLATTACGLSNQPEPSSADNAIQTAIISTAQAALDATLTAESVAVQATPGMTGTNLEKFEDGTAKYTDYDAGFEITYPAGWLTLRPNSDEFTAALSNEGVVNTMLHDQMTADQAGNSEFDRLYSYILRPDLQENVLFGFSSLKWDSDDPVSIDTVTMGKFVDKLESPPFVPGFRADVVQLHEDGATKIIEVGGPWSLSDGQGGTVPFYSTVLFFKPTPDSASRLIVTYLRDYRDQISPDVNSIMNSIRPLQQ